MKKAIILRSLIIGLAILNLIALFVFDYKLPFINDDENNLILDDDDSQEVSSYTITFDSDELVFDGSGNLDLMKGVTVNGPSGEIADAEVFANIVTADTLNKKEVIYSLDTDEGQVSAKRNLVLNNYTGPSLIIPETLPAVEEENLENYVALMPTDGSFKAMDGFGNDITSKVTASYQIEPSDPTLVHLVFSVTNMFNDKVSVPAEIKISSDRPILVLKQNSVKIAKGTEFLPYDYIEKAETRQGGDLLHTVVIEGAVDTNTPGKYTLEYLIDDNGTESLPQKLEVVVE